MEQVSISEIFEFTRNGVSIKQDSNASGIPITRIETIWNSKIDVDRLGYANVNNIEPYKSHQLEVGDILMSHINSPKHLGKCALYEGAPKVLIHGMNLLGLRPNKEKSIPKYLYFYLSSHFFRQQISKISNQSVNQASFSSGNLKKLKIPFPTLAEQQKIAATLDAADSLRQKDQQLIEHYTALSQSLFLEMFGDPVGNPMGWETCSLANYGDFKNGLNFKKGEAGVEVKYLGVGDFKSHSKIDDMSSLSLISLDDLPSESYFLKDGDLVFVRSNGNPALVGRCIVVYPQGIKVTYSGFCIRYRIDNDDLHETYLANLFREKSFKKRLLLSGQGANIQNINQKLLSELSIPLPPKKIQNQFAQRIEAIDQQKQQVQANLKKSEALFNSLLQRAFKGELTN